MDLLSRTRRLSAPPGPPPSLPKTAGCGGFESSPSFSTSSSNMPPRAGAPQPSVGFGNSGRSSGASVNSPRPRQDTLPPKIASLCEWFEEACSITPKDAEAYSWFFVDKGYDEPDHLMGIADDSAWPPGIKAAHKAKIIEVANAMLETDPLVLGGAEHAGVGGPLRGASPLAAPVEVGGPRGSLEGAERREVEGGCLPAELAGARHGRNPRWHRRRAGGCLRKCHESDVADVLVELDVVLAEPRAHVARDPRHVRNRGLHDHGDADGHGNRGHAA